MHRHITYYTQSTVCQSGFYERFSSNKFLSSCPWAYAGFAKGGPTFRGGGLAKRLLGGFGGMLPRKKNFESCNLVRFGAYFHKFFTFKKSKNIYLLYKNNDKL